MKNAIARLKITSRWEGEPTWIEQNYPGRILEFNAAQRFDSNRKHRDLFIEVGKTKQRFQCLCRQDKKLEVTVRLYQTPYLALMPRTSREHGRECAFYHEPIASHGVEAIKENPDGSLQVRLGFRLGRQSSKRSTGEAVEEAPLRTRQINRQHFNRFGPEGYLRLLFHEAGLHRWRSNYRQTGRVTSMGSWYPTYGRLRWTVGNMDARRQKAGALALHTRIGEPGPVAKFENDTILAVVDVIEKIEPPQKGYHWKCYLAGWGRNFLIIDPVEAESLLRKLRFPKESAKNIVAGRETASARDMETWWGCLIVRVEQGESGKRYRIIDHGVLRTDKHGIPAESLGEIEMIQYLIEQGRSFCKPLFTGELEAIPERRPDFILEDTAQPCCIEVIGMDGVYDYSDRNETRLADYEQAEVKCQSWKTGDPKPVFGAEFTPI